MKKEKSRKKEEIHKRGGSGGERPGPPQVSQIFSKSN